jgi:hypothetical protein
MQNIIISSGGDCERFNSPNYKESDYSKGTHLFVVCNNPNKTQQQQQREMINILDCLDCRLIDEAEIGLAIIYNSLKTNCNPVKVKSNTFMHFQQNIIFKCLKLLFFSIINRSS